MLDLENVPTDVTRIALAAMFHGITLPSLNKCTAEHAAVFAAEAGLTFEQYRAAIDWITDWFESHHPSGLIPN
jgi:hypothetical protein